MIQYGYSCAKCGVRHVSQTPLPVVAGGAFVCDGCKEDLAQLKGRTLDSLDMDQLTLGELSGFLKDNPTRRA